MLRKAGFLNLNQLMELVYREFSGEIDAIRSQGEHTPNGQEEPPNREDRARVWASWQWRTIIDDCHEVYLLHHLEEAVCVDAFSVFLPRKGFQALSSDFELRNPITPKNLYVFEQEMRFSWRHVDAQLGLLVVPARWSWKHVFGTKTERDIDDLLRSFDRRTVAIAEDSARETVVWIKQTLATSNGDGQEDGQLSNVFQTYLQAFPAGKGKATWQDVEARTGYSRRHLTRAIRQFRGRE